MHFANAMDQRKRGPVAWLLRWAPWLVAVLLALTAASTVYAVRLYRNLRTELEELLPTQARSVQDLDRVRSRLASSGILAILVFSGEPERSKRFVTDLAQRIERELGDVTSHVEYRIDREIRFFDHRRALMMDLGDLQKIHRYVKDRLKYEQDIRNPLNIFSGITLNPPSLDKKALESKYSGKVAQYMKFKDGYYEMDGGRIRAILVHVGGKALGVSEALRLRTGVDRIVERLDPGRYAPDIELKFTGDVQNLIEERDSLIADLEKSTAIVAVLVMLSLAVYYRSALGTTALIASLFAGTLWTFGIAYFVTGYLNANSAFLGAIVLGNGINFGILLLARYLEERARLSYREALPLAMRGALPGTLTAALAAALSYGSLGLTSFRGFRQFGIIGLIGMALCWISAFTLLPALLIVFERWREHGHPRRRPAAHERHGFAQLAASIVGRRPRTTLACGAVATAILATLALGHRGPILETDTSRLRDRRSLEEGSGYLSRFLDEMFGRSMSPLVILPKTTEGAREISQRIKRLRDSQGSDSLIANVYSMDDFVPSNQREKIAILSDINRILSPGVRAALTGKDAKLANDFLKPEAFKPFGVSDLPPLVRARFREADGSEGKLVLVEPILNEEVMHKFENQKMLIDEVRGIADAVDPGAPVVGQLSLLVDMIASIQVDGPKATLFAFGSVFLLTLFLFRNAAMILQAQAALLLGVGWMACAALALNLRVNFLNFIAFPITFGIGVDYAVNVLTRIHREKYGLSHVPEILRSTGGAVSLASLTTIIGYGSLLVAGNQGFVSFGRLAILGEITCLLTAVLVMPSFIQWRWERRMARIESVAPSETAPGEAAPAREVPREPGTETESPGRRAA